MGYGWDCSSTADDRGLRCASQHRYDAMLTVPTGISAHGRPPRAPARAAGHGTGCRPSAQADGGAGAFDVWPRCWNTRSPPRTGAAGPHRSQAPRSCVAAKTQMTREQGATGSAPVPTGVLVSVVVPTPVAIVIPDTQRRDMQCIRAPGANVPEPFEHAYRDSAGCFGRGSSCRVVSSVGGVLEGGESPHLSLSRLE